MKPPCVWTGSGAVEHDLAFYALDTAGGTSRVLDVGVSCDAEDLELIAY